jgi:hypothetical protein
MISVMIVIAVVAQGLADVLLRADATLAGCVARAVHDETQQFAQVCAIGHHSHFV